MKSSLLLALALGVATLFTSGCATQPTHAGKDTYLLGGLIIKRTNDYQPDGPIPDVIDGTKIYGGSPTGTSVSLLWDAIKYNNY